jgi:hypothetical protein
MFKELFEKRDALLEEIEHACWQMRHMAKRYNKPRKEPARMPQGQSFDIGLFKTSEG